MIAKARSSGDVDDPVAMVKGLDAVKEWVQAQGLRVEDSPLIIRENNENFLVRFHVPSIGLSPREIESFSGKKLLDERFEPLFRARLWLSSTRGHMNVYKATPNDTIIDLVFRTDQKIRENMQRIAKQEKWAGLTVLSERPNNEFAAGFAQWLMRQIHQLFVQVFKRYKP